MTMTLKKIDAFAQADCAGVVAPRKRQGLPFPVIRQVLVLSDFLIHPCVPAAGMDNEVFMLSKLFRSTPKWQSIKAQKRIEAIQALQPEREPDLEILTRLAREDSEPAVRREAVGKLHDIDILMQIQKRDLEAMVRDAAGARLHTLMAGKSPFSPPVEERLQRIERINSPLVLAELIREAEPVEVRLAAVAALRDDMYLQDIALHSPVARLRQAAAERITTTALLEELLATSRAKDKAVYKIAKGRLDELHEREKAERERKTRARELCEAMEAHARAALNPLYAAKAESLRQQWAALESTDTVLAERFATAYALAGRQVAEVVAAEQRAADEAQARQELQGAIDILESTVNEYDGQEDFDLPSLSAVRKTQRLRWELAAELHPVSADLARRYDKAMASLDALETLLARWQHDRPAVEAMLAAVPSGPDSAPLALDATQREAADALLSYYRQSGWPLPAVLQVLAGHLGVTAAAGKASGTTSRTTAAEEAVHRESLLRQLDDIEAYIQSGNSRKASRRWKQLTDYARAHHLHHPRLQSVGEQVRELKSWAGFAVLPKKEALLASMQSLVSLDTDPEDKADRIKALQDEWKALGVADPAAEQPLWEQFKAASDAAFEPCRQYFAAQREMRADNLRKRIMLCEQLEQYAATLTMETDWKQHDAIIRTARDEWQQYSPVDRQAGRESQDRFSALLKALETHREQHWKQIADAKQALVEKAVRLVDAADMRQACDMAKALQQEWKQIGSGAPRADGKQWKAFRAACDAVFQKRDEVFKARKEALDGVLQQAEALTISMEELLTSTDRLDREAAAQLEEAFGALDLGREGHSLRDRFRKARQAFDAACTRQAQQQSARKARAGIDAWVAVCAVEQAVMTQDPPLAPDIAALPAAWKSPLQSRLNAATAESVAHWNPSLIEANNRHLLDALMDLEIALGLPSPAAREQERRTRQLTLLQQKGLRNSAAADNGQKLQSLLATGPVDPSLVKESSLRLETIVARL